MPATYTLISSNVLSSSAASVTFSSIPATYTDLVIRCSGRSDSSFSAVLDLYLSFNGSTATYSRTQIRGYGSTADSSNGSGSSYWTLSGVSGTPATSNTFGSVEIYIPSYTVSQNKPIQVNSVIENNSSTVNRILGIAGLVNITAAVSSVKLETDGNFVSGSSFYLYGISNA
jgi:hypothetical protein